MYGTTLQIPGEFILPSKEPEIRDNFVTDYKQHIMRVKPVPVMHNDNRKIFLHRELNDCTHVFLGVGGCKRSLQWPYNGPFKITNRIDCRIYEIDVNGTKKWVSVENIKPVHFLIDQEPSDEVFVALPIVRRENRILADEIPEKSVTLQKEMSPLKNVILIRKNIFRRYCEKKKETEIWTSRIMRIIIPLNIPSNSNIPVFGNLVKREKFIPSILRRGPKKVIFCVNYLTKCTRNY